MNGSKVVGKELDLLKILTNGEMTILDGGELVLELHNPGLN